ncbi:GFA family protein [Qipengyuania flava]|uniref:GFA family protein n=1 Tax=Qipengyuania flava TaxID=192812 RepID=UPI001C588CF5|nr:GFA family protein [Qipengyuania flava]MBW3167876.1 GFA family protein [Qipengyuania flava]MBY5965114.1 GFA family protein [Qipengyuania flava]MBY6011438.1 GFA family protein [Qipengyuania flava]MBY6025880.1 GFA family protein [Qipengyuania flava]
MSGEARIEGHCLCGAVTIALDNPAQHIEICQCDMCRRWAGSFYSAQTGENPRVSGEEAVTAYQSSEWAERAFCSKCGSNLWYRFLPTGNRSFSAGLFDAAAKHTIEKEIFVDESADWSRIAGDHPRQTGEEVIAEAEAAGFTFD